MAGPGLKRSPHAVIAVALRACLTVCTLAALQITQGCTDDEVPVRYVNPLITTLRFDDFYSAVRDTGVIALSATLADSTASIAENERLVLHVLTSAGDSETVEFERKVCGVGNSPYLCTSLVVTMRSGHVAQELQPTLAAIPARFWLVSTSGTFASTRVFDSRTREHAISVLSRHPAVLSAQREIVGSAGGTSNLASRLFGALPLDFGPPTQASGVLEVSTGDTLRARYRQPDSAIAETLLVIP
jgi:hypothetical protein